MYAAWLRPRSSPTSTVALSWLVLLVSCCVTTRSWPSVVLRRPGCAASCAVWTRRTVLQRDPGLSDKHLVSAVTSTALSPWHRDWIFSEMTSMMSLYSAQCAAVYGASCSPSHLAVTCSVLYVAEVRARKCGIFWEFTSGAVSAFSACWLDSGYMYRRQFARFETGTQSAHCAAFCLDRVLSCPLLCMTGVRSRQCRNLWRLHRCRFRARLWWTCPSLCNDRAWSSCRRRQLEVPQIRSSPRCSRSEEEIFAAFCAFFALRPAVSAGWGGRRVPGVLPMELAACGYVAWIDTSCKHTVRTTTTTTRRLTQTRVSLLV